MENKRDIIVNCRLVVDMNRLAVTRWRPFAIHYLKYVWIKLILGQNIIENPLPWAVGG